MDRGLKYNQPLSKRFQQYQMLQQSLHPNESYYLMLEKNTTVNDGPSLCFTAGNDEGEGDNQNFMAICA
jgi:hypothetical protein